MCYILVDEKDKREENQKAILRYYRRYILGRPYPETVKPCEWQAEGQETMWLRIDVRAVNESVGVVTSGPDDVRINRIVGVSGPRHLTYTTSIQEPSARPRTVS